MNNNINNAQPTKQPVQPTNGGRPNSNGIEQATGNAQRRNDSNVQQRNANLEARTPSYNLSNSSKSSNNVTPYSQAQSSNQSNNARGNLTNSSSNIKPQNSPALNQASSIGLQALGIPKPASNMMVKSQRGQKMISRLKNRNLAMRVADKFAQKAEETVGSGEPSENDASNDMAEQANDQKDLVGGTFDIIIKIKKYKWFLIIGLSCFAIVFFLCIISAIFTNGTAAAGAFSGDASSESSAEQWDKEASDRMNSDTGLDDAESDVMDTENDTGFIDDIVNTNTKFVKNTLGLKKDDLADYYGVEVACNGTKKKKCTDGNEYKFYLKMYDLYFLYKNQYSVKLDLPLIMASLVYNDPQMPAVLKSNLNSYNREDIKTSDYQGDLSWEYDYKNISGYTYLNANDNRYDMQILAKNMVTKKTSYKCINGSTANTNPSNLTTDNSKKGNGWDSVTKIKYSNGIKRTYKNYKQYDNGNTYWNQKYWGGNIQSDGCGPSSIAIALSGYGYNYNPGNIVDQMKKLKITYTNSDNLVKVLKSLKIKAERKDITNEQEAINDIRNNFNAGRPVMIGTTDHWVVYLGENQNGLIISDPGNSDGNHARYGKTLEDLVKTPEVETYILIKSDGKTSSTNNEATDDIDYDQDSNDPNLITVKNVEKSKYQEKLVCDTGTLDESSIKETYELDKEKYDEFLLEYIEHKYFMKGSKVDNSEEISSSQSNSMAQAAIKVAEGELKKYNAGQTTAATYQAYTGLYDSWCASFVSYVVGNTEYNGKKLSDIIPVKSAAVNDFFDYLNAKNQIHINSSCSFYKDKTKYTPKMGDLIFVYNSGNSSSCPSLDRYCLSHIGIVKEVKNGQVITIEGNTGNGVLDSNSIEMNDCTILAYGSWY